MIEPGPRTGRSRFVIDGATRPWAALGPLAWAVLCELAASAVPDGSGWMAPVGSREVGAGVGLNKDTAARCLRALTAAGIIRRQAAGHLAPPRRSGYRLELPPGLTLYRTGPDTGPVALHTAAGPIEAARDVRPTRRDRGLCPVDLRGSRLRAGISPTPSDQRSVRWRRMQLIIR